MPTPDRNRAHLAAVRPPAAPPAPVDAEEAVLGAVLTAGRLLPEAAEQVTTEDFYRPAHRTIWQALTHLHHQDAPLDPITVRGELTRQGVLDDLGGPLFLHHLAEVCPTVAHAGHYAAQVAEAARRRRLMDLGTKITAGAGDPTLDPTDLAASWRGELDGNLSGDRGWDPPIPLGATSTLPTFPVEVLPGWIADYVAAVATATQTPPDLGGMLSLAVLAAVTAGAVEIQPRPGWREPLCVFIAVGMEAGSRKSAVFSALTGPLAAYEQDQAATALPAVTEAAVLRRVAEQAAQHAEAAAGKAPAEKAEELRAEAIARADEATRLTVPPVPRWLVDDATPEALASLLADHGRIALLSAEGDVFDQMAGRYQQASGGGPNLGVYLKGHAGDLLKVDRRGRPPEYIPRPCLTIGVSPQPDVLRGLSDRPGFRGRGLLARFLYSLPTSLLGRRQTGTPPAPAHTADRYAVELHTLASSLATPASLTDDEATLLHLDPDAAAILGEFETALEPRLAPGTGDLAHLAGWAAKLAGATCRLAGLLHLAGHLRDGWARPVAPDTLSGAIRLAGYLTDHALATFDLMGADPRIEDARWLLDWTQRTGAEQFTTREVYRAAPRGRFRKTADLDTPLTLLEQHGYLRRAEQTPPGGRGGRPASPVWLVNPHLHRQNCHNRHNPSPQQGSGSSVGSVSTTRTPHHPTAGMPGEERHAPPAHHDPAAPPSGDPTP